MPDTEPSRELDHDTYMKHRQILITGELEQSRSFDKHVLTLSAGALGLSVLFLREVAPRPVCWSFYFLISTWACFAASILATLLSFLTSQAAYRHCADAWDRQARGRRLDQSEPRNPYTAWTTGLNIASIGLFMIGVLALLIFAGANTRLTHQ